ncbi:MAG: FecR domain-containing protein [Cyclobacteriaceae bacterium]|nr:FecR domain-containing protein [Cyclobacteriaceae bacterium]
MDYTKYTAEDFACDAYFKQWVMFDKPEASQFWQKWMEGHPEKEQQITEAIYLIKTLSVPESLFDAQREKKLLQRIHTSIRKSEKAHRSITISIPKEWFSYAAVISVFLISGVLTWYLIAKSGLVLQEENLVEVPTQEKSIHHQTLRGEKLPLRLPDGSTVKLNAESSIRFAESFGQDHRKIFLSGEAFFDVVENEELPFIVETPSLSTRVLGTTFNVSAYPNDLKHHVYLVSGKVEVDISKGATAISLTEGEQLSLQADTKKHTKIIPHNANGILWTEGILIFEQSTLKDVFLELERWYGVEIHPDSGVDLQEKVSGKFKDETLINVVQSICFYVNRNYEIKKDKVFIK